MTAAADPPGDADALPTPEDLAALGLPDTATRVLALLGGEGWTTSVALATQLGVSRSVVSGAVDVLVEAGLVTRTRGRKPAPLRLHPDVDLVVTALLRELAEQRRDSAARAERAAAWLREAGTRTDGQPAPMRLLDPAGAPPDYRLATCRATYDEVCRPDSTSVLFSGGLARQGPRRRLLVLGQPPEHRGRHLLRFGVELRTTTADLTVLILADGQRARVEVSADGRSGRTGWTHDPAQVAALRLLFELWWDAGTQWGG